MNDDKPWAVVPIDAASAMLVPAATTPAPAQPFRLKPELYGKNRRKLILQLALLYAGSGTAGLLIFVIAQGGMSGRAFILWLVSALPVLALMAAFVIWRKERAMNRRYHSFRLWIDENGLRREQALTTPVELKRSEITACLEIPGKGTLVKTASARTYVWVANELDGYAFALDMFRRWGKLVPEAKLPPLFRPAVSFTIGVGSVAVMFLSHNPIFITVVGAACLGAMAWQTYVVAFGINADPQVRRQVWSAAFSALVILGRMIYVWL